MKTHGKRVMGLAIDKRFGNLYSIGEDGRFKATGLGTKNVIFENVPGKAGLKSMLYE